MKIIKKILIVFFCILYFNSCDSILDTTPTDFLNPAIAFETTQNIDRALVGVYDALYNVHGTSWVYRYGLEADEALYRGRELTGIVNNSFNASEPYIRTIYSDLYRGVTRANMLLENVDNNPEIDKEYRDQVRGETLFLRAHYYFMFTQMFGGVPLFTTNPKTPEQVHIPRASVKEMYDQITQDLLTAEELVPDIQTLGFGGRVNKSAVRGYLARVYLHMGGTQLGDKSKYAEAEKWALKIINEGYHELNSSYSDIFINYAADKYDPKESIFEIEFWGNRSDSYIETGQNGAANGPRCTNPETGVATGMLNGNKFLYDLYKDGDLRRGWNIVNFTYDATGSNGAKTFVSENRQIYDRSAGKFRREYEVVTPKMANWTPQNMPLLRYADVLLMFAEANNEINSHPTPEAIEAVNKVRRRAWATGGIKSFTITNPGGGYTTPPKILINGDSTIAVATVSGGRLTSVKLQQDDVTGFKYGKYNAPPFVQIVGNGAGATVEATLFKEEEADLSMEEVSNKDKFREAIQNERAKELCYEWLRKFDLIRWGIYVDRMHEIGDEILLNYTPLERAEVFSARYKNVQEKHNLFPIPELELIRNNALVGHQNPGWE